MRRNTSPAKWLVRDLVVSRHSKTEMRCQNLTRSLKRKTKAKLRPEKWKIGLENRSGNRSRNPLQESGAQTEAEMEAKMRPEKRKIRPKNQPPKRAEMATGNWHGKAARESSFQDQISGVDFRFSGLESRAYSLRLSVAALGAARLSLEPNGGSVVEAPNTGHALTQHIPQPPGKST